MPTTHNSGLFYANNMVKIAKSYDTDVDFIAKYNVLKQFLATERRLPTLKGEKKLYKFVSKLRMKYRTDPQLPFWEWRIPMLSAIGLNITARATISRAPSPSNIEPHWRATLNILRTISDNKRRQQDLHWFHAISGAYKNRTGFVKQQRFTTLQELFVKWCQLGDISPIECTRGHPTYDIRHTLSYIVAPLTHCESPPLLAPTQRFNIHTGPSQVPPEWTATIQCGNTVYFDPDCFDSAIFSDTLSSLPQWMMECYNGTITPKGEDIVRLIQPDEHSYDRYPYAIQGDNWRFGTQEITASQFKGPRRLNLYDKVNEYTHSAKFNCTIQDGFSYTLSFHPPVFYGGRSLQNYPAIANLKVAVWKHVHHWLTPISKLCPPNGVQCLLYIDDFNEHNDHPIRPHKDMSLDMNVDPKTNSQIIGSSVIVVSFFDDQFIRLGTWRKSKFKDRDAFLTKHCSVCVLDANDDTKHWHTTRWPPTYQKQSTRKTRIRYAITFRWLGNRKQFFGPDSKSGLQHKEVVTRPHQFIQDKWKRSPQTATMWKEALAKHRRTHTTTPSQSNSLPV